MVVAAAVTDCESDDELAWKLDVGVNEAAIVYDPTARAEVVKVQTAWPLDVLPAVAVPRVVPLAVIVTTPAGTWVESRLLTVAVNVTVAP